MIVLWGPPLCPQVADNSEHCNSMKTLIDHLASVVVQLKSPYSHILGVLHYMSKHLPMAFIMICQVKS